MAPVEVLQGFNIKCMVIDLSENMDSDEEDVFNIGEEQSANDEVQTSSTSTNDGSEQPTVSTPQSTHSSSTPIQNSTCNSNKSWLEICTTGKRLPSEELDYINRLDRVRRRLFSIGENYDDGGEDGML